MYTYIYIYIHIYWLRWGDLRSSQYTVFTQFFPIVWDRLEDRTDRTEQQGLVPALPSIPHQVPKWLGHQYRQVKPFLLRWCNHVWSCLGHSKRTFFLAYRTNLSCPKISWSFMIGRLKRLWDGQPHQGGMAFTDTTSYCGWLQNPGEESQVEHERKHRWKNILSMTMSLHRIGWSGFYGSTVQLWWRQGAFFWCTGCALATLADPGCMWHFGSSISHQRN